MIDTQELMHGPLWHSHDDSLALWVIVLGLSFIGVMLWLEKTAEERRNK